MILGIAWYHTILAFFFAVLAILLMIGILLQRGKGVGLAGAFGGTGGATAFGAKTGDVLTWITIVGAALLLTFTVALNFVFNDSSPGLAASSANTAPGPGGSSGAPSGAAPAGEPTPVAAQPPAGQVPRANTGTQPPANTGATAETVPPPPPPPVEAPTGESKAPAPE
jgi:preprotein translocase subunit SecG